MTYSPAIATAFSGASTPAPFPRPRFATVSWTPPRRKPTRERNPEFDGLVEKYYVTINWTDRMNVLGQLIHHMTDNLVVMTILDDATPTMIPNKMLNVTPFVPVANIWEWDLK